MNKYVALFPGQTSQFQFMGEKLWTASSQIEQLFEEASDICGYDIKQICMSKEKLQQTKYSQIALFVCSVAAFESCAKAEIEKISAFAGHSLGEFSALVCSGTLSFQEGLLLVKKRGELMSYKSKDEHYLMASIAGLNNSEITDLCQKVSGSQDKVYLSCDNNQRQKVVSGSKNAVEKLLHNIENHQKETISGRVISSIGPFHSEYMKEAQNKLEKIIDDLSLKDSHVFLMSNVTGFPYKDSEMIRHLLKRQMCSPVEWRAIIHYLYKKGFREFIEFGPSKVLTNLLKADFKNLVIKNIDC